MGSLAELGDAAFFIAFAFSFSFLFHLWFPTELIIPIGAASEPDFPRHNGASARSAMAQRPVHVPAEFLTSAWQYETIRAQYFIKTGCFEKAKYARELADRYFNRIQSECSGLPSLAS